MSVSGLLRLRFAFKSQFFRCLFHRTLSDGKSTLSSNFKNTLASLKSFAFRDPEAHQLSLSNGLTPFTAEQRRSLLLGEFSHAFNNGDYESFSAFLNRPYPPNTPGIADELQPMIEQLLSQASTMEIPVAFWVRNLQSFGFDPTTAKHKSLYNYMFALIRDIEHVTPEELNAYLEGLTHSQIRWNELGTGLRATICYHIEQNLVADDSTERMPALVRHLHTIGAEWSSLSYSTQVELENCLIVQVANKQYGRLTETIRHLCPMLGDINAMDRDHKANIFTAITTLLRYTSSVQSNPMSALEMSDNVVESLASMTDISYNDYPADLQQALSSAVLNVSLDTQMRNVEMYSKLLKTCNQLQVQFNFTPSMTSPPPITVMEPTTVSQPSPQPSVGYVYIEKPVPKPLSLDSFIDSYVTSASSLLSILPRKTRKSNVSGSAHVNSLTSQATNRSNGSNSNKFPGQQSTPPPIVPKAPQIAYSIQVQQVKQCIHTLRTENKSRSDFTSQQRQSIFNTLATEGVPFSRSQFFTLTHSLLRMQVVWTELPPALQNKFVICYTNLPAFMRGSSNIAINSMTSETTTKQSATKSTAPPISSHRVLTLLQFASLMPITEISKTSLEWLIIHFIHVLQPTEMTDVIIALRTLNMHWYNMSLSTLTALQRRLCENISNSSILLIYKLLGILPSLCHGMVSNGNDTVALVTDISQRQQLLSALHETIVKAIIQRRDFIEKRSAEGDRRIEEGVCGYLDVMTRLLESFQTDVVDKSRHSKESVQFTAPTEVVTVLTTQGEIENGASGHQQTRVVQQTVLQINKSKTNSSTAWEDRLVNLMDNTNKSANNSRSQHNTIEKKSSTQPTIDLTNNDPVAIRDYFQNLANLSTPLTSDMHVSVDTILILHFTTLHSEDMSYVLQLISQLGYKWHNMSDRLRDVISDGVKKNMRRNVQDLCRVMDAVSVMIYPVGDITDISNSLHTGGSNSVTNNSKDKTERQFIHLHRVILTAAVKQLEIQQQQLILVPGAHSVDENTDRLRTSLMRYITILKHFPETEDMRRKIVPAGTFK